jgi:hypothetical protein
MLTACYTVTNALLTHVENFAMNLSRRIFVSSKQKTNKNAKDRHIRRHTDARCNCCLRVVFNNTKQRSKKAPAPLKTVQLLLP